MVAPLQNEGRYREERKKLLQPLSVCFRCATKSDHFIYLLFSARTKARTSATGRVTIIDSPIREEAPRSRSRSRGGQCRGHGCSLRSVARLQARVRRALTLVPLGQRLELHNVARGRAGGQLRRRLGRYASSCFDVCTGHGHLGSRFRSQLRPRSRFRCCLLPAFPQHPFLVFHHAPVPDHHHQRHGPADDASDHWLAHGASSCASLLREA